MKGKKLMSESMVNALRKIIKENGEEILAENIDRVYNFLTDLVPKEETQRKCIRLALRSGAMKPLYSISAAPEDSEALFKKSVVMVADENCWRDDVAYDTMFSLFSALYPELAGRMTQPTADGTAEIQNASPELLAGGISGIIDENQILGYEYDDEDYSRTWALEFREDKDGYVISNYTAFGPESNVELPVRYKGERLVGIGDSAFANADIRSVKGNSIKRIGAGAFENCTIASFDFPNLVNIDDGAFGSCQHLTNIFLADSVESIGRNVFENINIGKIVLSKKLKEIEAEDLKKCAEIYVPGIKTEIKFEPKRFGTAGSYRTLGKDYIFPDGRRAVLTQKDLDKIINNYLEQSTIYCAINSRAYSFAKAYEIKCLPLPQNYRPH